MVARHPGRATAARPGRNDQTQRPANRAHTADDRQPIPFLSNLMQASDFAAFAALPWRRTLGQDWDGSLLNPSTRKSLKLLKNGHLGRKGRVSGPSSLGKSRSTGAPLPPGADQCRPISPSVFFFICP